MKENIERIKELTLRINRYRDTYYNHSESLITDAEYDCLFDELKQLETETGMSMSNSPTKTVGYTVSSRLMKTKHEFPMLSLDKTKSYDEIRRFVGNKKALIMLKLDGLTIAATYENGELIKAETRGDGEVGELITDNARTFSNLPLNIPYKGKLVVFGEAIIDYNTFDRINSGLSQENKYKNPRNLASGTVRQLDSKICAERNVRFVAWRLVEGSNSNSFMKRLDELDSYGFETVQTIWYNDNKIEESLEAAKDAACEMGLPIDGCVISFDDISYLESLGATTHHLRGQLAFKFTEEKETTVLRDIEWSMGKTGVLTPVAIFDPVELAGTTVSRASLHNLSIMEDLRIKIGSDVTVVKKNEIIPQIIECNSKCSDVPIPAVCPICGEKTIISKDNESKVLMCSNSTCKGKLLGRLTHAVSKNALNIDGLSESTIEKFISLGWLYSIKGIYHLKNHADSISKLNGFGKRSSDKLLKAIEDSRNTNLARILYAHSIPLIGKTASKDISKVCDEDINEFRRILKERDFKVLTNIDGFGDTMLNSLYVWWCEQGMNFVELAEEFTFEKQLKPEVANNASDLSGRIFVITGSLIHFTNREEAKERIESLNGKVSGSVSSKTSYLVCNENSNSGKSKKAKELGVPIITEEQLIKMMQ